MQRLMIVITLALLASCKSNDRAMSDPIYLNHLFITVDDATFASINDSSFVRDELANFVAKTTKTGSGEAWTGLYLHGSETYLEIFRASPTQSNLGESGIGFGVDKSGELKSVERRLRALFGSKVKSTLKTRLLNDQKAPWFHYLFVESDEERIKTLDNWIMEYDKNYLTAFYPDKAMTADTTSRKIHQSFRFDKKKLMMDIKEISVELNEIEHAEFLSHLRAYNMQCTTSRFAAKCNGNAVSFMLDQTEVSRGVTRIVFSLSQRLDSPRTYKFGPQSTLTLQATSGVWTFREPGT
jgi:hypothetical protein